MMNPKVIGKRLRELRGEKTVQCVADAVGISRSALAMYEIGDRIPRDEIKIRFSAFFGVPVGSIFDQ